jgi:hypothetical protein
MKRFDDFEEDDYQDGDSKRLSKVGRKLILQNRADSFRCVGCNREVSLLVPGSEHRNHCPFCLASRHVDEAVGDRKATCLSVMKPRAIAVRTSGELAIVQVCAGCGKVHANRILGDDQPLVLEDLGRQTIENREALSAEFPEFTLLSELFQLTSTL